MFLEFFIILLYLSTFELKNISEVSNINKRVSTVHSFIKTTVKSTSPVTSPWTIPGAPGKIIGGHNCDAEKYPFMVSLRRLKTLSHFCAGTLIRPNWVMTAGHCVAPHADEPRLFTVIAGISQFNELGIQRIRVNKIIIHPEFDENNHDNDIAMICLEHNFVITELVKPITIPNHVIHEDLSTVCPEGIIIGWGWHNKTKVEHFENGSISHIPVMQCVINLPVLSDQQCQNARAGLHLRPNTFCTMVPTWENLCQGDSGGPLFCNNVQYGVVSKGYTCHFLHDTPGYYTRIDRVLNFIKECLSGQVSYYRNIRHEVDAMEDGSLGFKLNSLLLILSIFLY